MKKLMLHIGVRFMRWPSRRRWAAAGAGALGVLALLFAINAGILIVFLYTAGLLLLAARLMMKVWLAPVRTERTVDREVVEIGAKVRVVVELTNSAWWPILWLYAEETLPPGFAREGMTRRMLFLPPGETFQMHYEITLTRRGCHRLGPLVLESGDVFGLFREVRIDSRRNFVTVLPRYDVIEEVQPGQARRMGGMAAMRSIFEDPSLLQGVRDYRRGDPMKRIHWKSTARAGRLVSKIYEPIQEAGATVILDFHEDAWQATVTTGEHTLPPTERAVTMATSICRYLADGGWKIGFFSNGRDPLGMPGITMAEARAAESLSDAQALAAQADRDDRLAPIAIRARRNADQFRIIHENLGRIELSDGLRLDELIFAELPYIEREQVLIWITGGFDDAAREALARAHALGYRIMFFVVNNNEAHDRAFEALLPAGIEVYRMDEDWRLREVATGRRSM